MENGLMVLLFRAVLFSFQEKDLNANEHVLSGVNLKHFKQHHGFFHVKYDV